MGDAPGSHARFAPLDAPLAEDARIAGVAWERVAEAGEMPAHLGATGSLLDDLLLALQGTHLVATWALGGRKVAA